MQPMVQSILDLFQHFARVMRTKRDYSKKMSLWTACLFMVLKEQKVYKSLLEFYALSVSPSPVLLVSDGEWSIGWNSKI